MTLAAIEKRTIMSRATGAGNDVRLKARTAGRGSRYTQATKKEAPARREPGGAGKLGLERELARLAAPPLFAVGYFFRGSSAGLT